MSKGFFGKFALEFQKMREQEALEKLDTENLPFAKFEEIVNSKLTVTEDKQQTNEDVKSYKLCCGKIHVIDACVFRYGSMLLFWRINVRIDDLSIFVDRRNGIETQLKNRYF